MKDMNLFEQETIKSAGGDVNLGDYDFVVLVAAGQVWPHAKCSLPSNQNDGSRTLKGIVVNEFSSMETYAHELGHVLPTDYKPRNGCGFPDVQLSGKSKGTRIQHIRRAMGYNERK